MKRLLRIQAGLGLILCLSALAFLQPDCLAQTPLAITNYSITCEQPITGAPGSPYLATTYTSTPGSLNIVEDGVYPGCRGNFVGTRYINLQLTFKADILGSGNPNPTGYGYEIRNEANAVIVSFTPYTLGTSVNFTPNNQGFYTFILYEWDQSQQYLSIGHGRILAIRRIQDAWVDAPPICAATYQTGQDYTFNIKTDISISSIMRSVPGYVTGGQTGGQNPSCVFAPTLHIENTAYSPSGMPVEDHSDPVNTNGTHYYGQFWALNPLTQTQIETRTIRYSDLAPLLTSSASSIDVQVTVKDHYAFEKSFTIRIPIEHANATEPANHHLDDYTVTGNEVWTPQANPFNLNLNTTNPVYRIKDKLTIPPDASLTIQDMTIEFGPEGYYEVQASSTAGSTAGGYLKLDGAKLTGYLGCGATANQAMWEGGDIWGCYTCPQQPVNGKLRQGMLEMVNGAEISFANEAAQVWRPGDMTSTGGIVQATASAFRNNSRSVEFIKYRNFLTQNTAYTMPNKSFFYNCDFVVDENLSPYGFRAHLSGWDVKGVAIKGCRFKNLALENGFYTINGTGIEGYDFGFTVDRYAIPNCTGSNCSVPSEFVSLHRAIHNQSVSKPASVWVNRAQFYNNYEGVTAPAVTRNLFEVPAPVGYISPFSFSGVFIKTGSGYEVTDNSFAAQEEGYATGALAWNTGSDDNRIQRNAYESLNAGNLSNYINRHPSSSIKSGLQFLCNTHDKDNFDEAARGNNSSSDGIRSDQGSAAVAAGNVFNNGSNLVYNIYNPTAEVGGITYFYSTTTPPSASGNVSFASGITNTCEAPSNENPSEEFPWTPPKGFDGRTGGNRRVPEPLTYYLNHPDGLASHDSLLYWAEQWQSPYGDLLKTDLLIQDGGSASSILGFYDGIETVRGLSGDEATEFSDWGRRLINLQLAIAAAGTHDRDLTSVQLSTLDSVATYGKMWARVRAQAWLSLYDGRSFTDTLLYPEAGSGGGGGGSPKMTRVRAYTGPLVYPNPASSTLNVVYQGEPGRMVTLQLTDLLGREVLRSGLAYGETPLDISRLQKGLYLWRISDAGVEKAHGKFVKE